MDVLRLLKIADSLVRIFSSGRVVGETTAFSLEQLSLQRRSSLDNWKLFFNYDRMFMLVEPLSKLLLLLAVFLGDQFNRVVLLYSLINT